MSNVIIIIGHRHFSAAFDCENIPSVSDLGSLMTLSVTDSFLHQEVSDSLYLNADEMAMGASKWHADLDRKRLIHMQA